MRIWCLSSLYSMVLCDYFLISIIFLFLLNICIRYFDDFETMIDEVASTWLWQLLCATFRTTAIIVRPSTLFPLQSLVKATGYNTYMYIL